MSDLKVSMLPHVSQLQHDESGIRRVIEAYFKYLPKFGIELVAPDATTYDLRVSHAASFAEDVGVLHNHGFYWTADYQAPGWEWMTNSWVVAAVRMAKEVTVPSKWVAETFQRDMRFTPHVVPHGIDWEEWQEPAEHRGFVLWNKNRVGDVCDPTPVKELANRFPSIPFVSTFLNKPPPNVAVVGVLPFEEMKKVVMTSSVYLATTKETFGIGILEAMASAVPVLGYAHGGILDLVEHGVTGYLAEPGNLEDLAEGLQWCMTNTESAGKNAREATRHYDWDRVCEEVAYIYRLAMIEEEPTVSIVIPSFNYGDEVGKAVESAIRQTYGKIDQVVVVDDGSADDGKTRKVVEGYGRRDARVKYCRQENKGVAHARNAGIGSVDSKYVCCLDADDEIGPRFIEVAVAALEADRSLGIAYTQLWFVKPDGSQGLSVWPGPPDFDKQIKRQNQIPTCCVFKREMWERLGGYKHKYVQKGGAGSEDAEFWLRAGASGYGARLADPHVRFREIYHRLSRELKRKPTKDEVVATGISPEDYDLVMDSLFVYSWMSGIVTGDEEYVEIDWTSNHPWADADGGDGQHPFASGATPERNSHPVRQYDEPVVSVVIPVGEGHEELVRDALDSLDAQTMRRWEAIVVWDCAPDWELLEAFTKAYPHVRQMFTHYKDAVFNAPSVHPYSLPNQPMGPGFARNIGAAQARAPFLWFLDADDWLYPETLAAVLEAWKDEGQIIYTDYVGKAIVTDPTQLAQSLQDHMYEWDGENAVIGYRAAEYECARAVREPVGEGRPYLWALVSCLIPKAWHDAIGGFDESMATWEDVEYHWRMAKAGYCYVRLAKELLVYRFNEGIRRETGLPGRQHYDEVVEYIREKHKEIEVMGCNCGGRKSRSSSSDAGGGRPDPRVAARGGPIPAVRHQAATANQLTDGDFVKAKYLHPNRGQHRVIGSVKFPTRFTGINMRDKGDGFVIDYGYRAGGDTFLVHCADQDLQKHLFQIVEDRIPTPASAREALPPPPTASREIPPSHIGKIDEAPNLMEIAEAAKEAMPEGMTAEKTFDSIMRGMEEGFVAHSSIDLQTFPGITAEIARQLEADGVTTVDAIKALGVAGLQKYRGIGEVKAQRILDALAASGR